MIHAPIHLPEQLSDYYTDLGQELGIGGFARVILARHNDTGLKVAIKIIYKELIKNELFRIHNEVSIMKRLNHQNICRLFQFFETDDHAFMILEYLSGGELYDQIVVNKCMDEKEARRIFRQVLSAVGYIHSCGIAHRDLKPENVLIDEFKNIRIIDFGLSACPTGGLISPLDTLCGSIAYAAPELLSGESYLGNEVDIWSMGILLFTLLCGYLPFDNNSNIHSALENIEMGIYHFPPNVSKEARDLIAQMLEPDPKKRQTVWKLANHEWITRGYGCSVSWGTISDKPKLNNNFIKVLSDRYSRHPNQIESMIKENTLNEITSHYYFLKQIYSYRGVSSAITPSSLEFNENIPMAVRSPDASPTRQPASPNGRSALPKPAAFSNATFVIDTGKENYEMASNKKRKICSERKESQKIQPPSSLNSTPNKSTENSHDTSAKSKNKIIGKLAGLFTPKRFQAIQTYPRVFKPAANVRVANTPDFKQLQTAFDTTLLKMKNDGDIISVKFENCVYKCEKLQSNYKIVFTLEVCKISTSTGQLDNGVFMKRIKGDSWEYKKAMEEISQTIFENTGIRI